MCEPLVTADHYYCWGMTGQVLLLIAKSVLQKQSLNGHEQAVHKSDCDFSYLTLRHLHQEWQWGILSISLEQKSRRSLLPLFKVAVHRAKELTGFFLPPWHKSSLLTMCLVPQKTLQSNTALIKEKPRITNNYPHKIKILPTLNQCWHVKWIIFSTLLCLFFFSLPKCVSCMSKLNIKEDQANSQFVGAFVGAF